MSLTSQLQDVYGGYHLLATPPSDLQLPQRTAGYFPRIPTYGVQWKGLDLNLWFQPYGTTPLLVREFVDVVPEILQMRREDAKAAILEAARLNNFERKLLMFLDSQAINLRSPLYILETQIIRILRYFAFCIHAPIRYNNNSFLFQCGTWVAGFRDGDWICYRGRLTDEPVIYIPLNHPVVREQVQVEKTKVSGLEDYKLLAKNLQMYRPLTDAESYLFEWAYVAQIPLTLKFH